MPQFNNPPAAEFIKELTHFAETILKHSAPSSVHSQSSTSLSHATNLSRRHGRRQQDKAPGLETDPEPTDYFRQTKSRAKERPWDSMTDEKPKTTKTKANAPPPGNRTMMEKPGASAVRPVASRTRKKAPRTSHSSSTTLELPEIFDTDHYAGDDSGDSDTLSDLSSNDQGSSEPSMSDSIIRMLNECWDVTPQPSPLPPSNPFRR